jgi:hypothetical protein
MEDTERSLVILLSMDCSGSSLTANIIAMSLFTRFESGAGYWTRLDVVAVHLQQLQAIGQAQGAPSAGPRPDGEA